MENIRYSGKGVSRRSFVKSSIYGALTAGLFASRVQATTIWGNSGSMKAGVPGNKRELVLSVLDMSKPNKYVPAAFFMHFGKDYRSGQAAIDRHLQYFRATDMDFVKIQYELGMPRMELQKPSDWSNIPVYGEDFFEPMLTLVSGIIKEIRNEALVLPTLYSPFMCANQIVGKSRLMEHINEDPEAVAKGMEIITASLMNYINACIRLGVDGFYTSTQGGEVNRIADRSIFDKVVRPFDLALMKKADEKCVFNILHICDYEGKYADLSLFTDYPGKVVNTPIVLADGTPVTTKASGSLFARPVMGGLNRLGEISKKDPDHLREIVDQALKDAPDNFILAADCTVPPSTSWTTLYNVIQQAHIFRT